MEDSSDFFDLMLTSLQDEILILSRIIYKIKNQQRSNISFRHIMGVKRLSLKLFKEGKGMSK